MQLNDLSVKPPRKPVVVLVQGYRRKYIAIAEYMDRYELEANDEFENCEELDGQLYAPEGWYFSPQPGNLFDDFIKAADSGENSIIGWYSEWSITERTDT